MIKIIQARQFYFKCQVVENYVVTIHTARVSVPKEYAYLTDNIEMKLDEADWLATATDERLSHETVFSHARRPYENI